MSRATRTKDDGALPRAAATAATAVEDKGKSAAFNRIELSQGPWQPDRSLTAVWGAVNHARRLARGRF